MYYGQTLCPPAATLNTEFRACASIPSSLTFQVQGPREQWVPYIAPTHGRCSGGAGNRVLGHHQPWTMDLHMPGQVSKQWVLDHPSRSWCAIFPSRGPPSTARVRQTCRWMDGRNGEANLPCRSDWGLFRCCKTIRIAILRLGGYSGFVLRWQTSREPTMRSWLTVPGY